MQSPAMHATNNCQEAAAAPAVDRTQTTAPNTDIIVWKRWCRLCAKEDSENNLCIFTEQGETKAMDTTFATAIGKFFWVNIRPNDDLSKYVCVECHTLIASLMQFTERVNKVQAMFCALQNTSNPKATVLTEIKLQYGLLDIEFEHIIKHERKSKVVETNDNEAIWQIESEDEAENKDTEILELDADGESKAGGDYEIEFVRREGGTDGADDKTITDTATEDEAFKPHILSLTKLIGAAKEEEEAEEHISFENANEEQLDDAELLKQLMGDEDEEENEIKEVAEEMPKKPTPNKDNRVNETKQEETYEEEEELILTEEMLDNNDEEAATDPEQTSSSNLVEVEVVENSAQVNKIDSSSQVVRKKRGRPFKYDSYDVNPKKDEHNKQGEIESDDCEDENAASTYKYECTVCQKKYKNPTSYRKHIMEKHAKEPDLPDFKCKTCEKILPTERQLEVHMRTHLALEDKLVVPCPYCERKFTKTAVMRQHVRGIHENRKPYICDICGQSSKTMAALAEHKLVHTNETPYECEECHRAFKNKARLKVHLETHNDSSFICTECGLKLNTRRTLKMHMLVHSDAKRYKCDFCPAAFKRTKALKNHLILHTGMRPYKCNFCGKTFSNGSNCRSHKKKMHAQELAEEEATGKKTEVVTVPKLDELRQSTNVVGNPRKVHRYSGGLPQHMRDLLIAAEERFKREQETTHMEIIEDDTLSDCVEPTMEFEIEDETKNIQLQQRMIEDDDDNEMVVYEIIAEI